MKKRPVKERFWEKVDKSGDCWMWTARVSKQGYGCFPYRGATLAHRVAWYLEYGEWPADGMTIDHLCFNPGCVRVDHLEVVTMRENILRGSAPSAVNARKTECLRGHPLSGDNLRLDTGGGRICVICQNASSRRYFSRNKERTNKKHRQYYVQNRERILARMRKKYAEA